MSVLDTSLSDSLQRPWTALFHAESSKPSSKKRQSSSSGTIEPKAKKPKQQRAALNEAATAMHAELRAMGFTSLANFSKTKWEDFKSEFPAVNTENAVAKPVCYMQSCLPLMFMWHHVQKVDSIVQARQQVFSNFHMKEDRLMAIQILATHWRNQRKMFVKKTKELASVNSGKCTC